MKKDKKFILTISLVALALLTLFIGTDLIQKNNQNQEMVAELDKNPLPQLNSEVAEDESLVLVHTTAGDIKIKLFNKYAPLAVENFLTHSQNGYYNNTAFHRVLKGFMIQGGDPSGDGTGGQSIWNGVDSSIDSGDGFADEISPNLYNIRGALSMANKGQNTNGSEFFIVQNSFDTTNEFDKYSRPTKIFDAYKNGGFPGGDGVYTVFGQVIEGMDVVDKIAAGEVTDNGQGETSSPVNPEMITSIEVLQTGQVN